MKKYKVTLISMGKKEVYEVDGLVDIIHLVIDLVIIKISRGNVILQIEKQNEDMPEKAKKSSSDKSKGKVA